MYNKEIIPLENHLRFVESLKDRNDVAYWLVRKEAEAIGVTNLTDINIEESSAELGYYMLPSKLNSGLGLEFAYNNLLFVFNTQIQCDSLHGAIHRSNINALVLDSYLGCEIQMDELKQSDKEYIPFTVSKDKFLANASGKNDMRAFISYVKAHRKDFQV
jgi:UDP-4-amino-4,6-dideoxy-N-acetyl-beta-L-altrosamine N-acetyltransferase